MDNKQALLTKSVLEASYPFTDKKPLAFPPFEFLNEHIFMPRELYEETLEIYNSEWGIVTA